MILGQDHVGLLQAAGRNHRINLAHLDRVELLYSLLDQGLRGTAVNNEDECVVVFDGLDGRLR